ncbi:MAG: C2H2-type zinc finger protein [Candidatus Hermodarchaeota archaeon]
MTTNKKALYKCKDHPQGDPKCPFVTKWKQSLIVHIRRAHTGEKPFKCKDHPQGDPKCPKAYASSSDLTDHIRRAHTGEKPYRCKDHPQGDPKCPKAYASSGELIDHIRRHHTGEKPFKCPYSDCPKAYANSSDLIEHIRRTHTREKPHKCPRCNYAAVSSSELANHLDSEGCDYYQWQAYLWQDVCRELTVWVRPNCTRLPSKILTPEIPDREYILPDNPLQHPDGTTEIAEAKRTPYAITEKDLVIYPQFADKVTFWCLFGEPGRFKDDPNLSIEISDQLIDQLEALKTPANCEELDRFIFQITLLQRGIDFRKHRPLTDFLDEPSPDPDEAS